jgi:hypothetical protein
VELTALKAERMRGVLADLGVDTKKIAAAPKTEGGTGGPFVAALPPIKLGQSVGRVGTTPLDRPTSALRDPHRRRGRRPAEIPQRQQQARPGAVATDAPASSIRPRSRDISRGSFILEAPAQLGLSRLNTPESSSYAKASP